MEIPISGSASAFYRLADTAGEFLVHQDFSRVPDSPSGSVPRPEVGEEWYLRGIGWTQWTQIRARGGFAVDENPFRTISYLCQRLPQTPFRVEMVGEWRPFFPGGTVDTVFTIALCRPTEAEWHRNSVHVRFHRDSVAVDFGDGGALVLNSAVRPLGRILEAGRPHHFAVAVDRDRVRVWVDGRLFIEDVRAEYGRNAGPYVFWELYSDPGVLRNTGLIRSLAAYAPLPSGLSAR
jgi:hypothetical protein